MKKILFLLVILPAMFIGSSTKEGNPKRPKAINFIQVAHFPHPRDFWEIFYGDANHNGKPELVLRARAGNVFEEHQGNNIYLEVDSAYSDSVGTHNYGVYPSFMGHADFDSLTDRTSPYDTVTGMIFRLMESNAVDSFPKRVMFMHTPNPATSLYSTYFYDADKDGKMDIICCGNRLSVYECVGNDSFENVLNDDFRFMGVDIAIGDFDQDGRTEFCFGNSAGNNGAMVYIYECQGENVYTKIDSMDVALRYNNIYQAAPFEPGRQVDMDSDGKLEFLCSGIKFYAGGGSTAFFSVFECNGNNTFTEVWTDSFPRMPFWGYHDIGVGDLDRDGKDEMVCIDSRRLSVYKAYGDNNYQEIFRMNPGDGVGQYEDVRLLIYDFNKNGYAEIVASLGQSFDYETYVYEIDTLGLSQQDVGVSEIYSPGKIIVNETKRRQNLDSENFHRSEFKPNLSLQKTQRDSSEKAPVVLASTSIVPSIYVCNYSSKTAPTFNVSFIMDSLGVKVYQSIRQVDSLVPFGGIKVSFDPWTAGPPANTYNLCAFTSLISDQNPKNDTLKGIAYTITHLIRSPFITTAPIIDGVISAGEWDKAFKVDVSNMLEWGYIDTSIWGSAYLYVMNDSSNLYLALDGIYDTPSAGTNDINAFEFYFDDNHNHQYPLWPDSSESGFWLQQWNEPSQRLNCFSVAADSAEFAYREVFFPHKISYGSNHPQFEVAIPFGARNESLDVVVGDTFGFWMAAADYYEVVAVYGWWPQDAVHTHGQAYARCLNPTYYGDIILGSSPVSVEEIKSTRYMPLLKFSLHQNYPNPFNQATAIKYQIAKECNVRIKIYNVNCQLVRILADEKKKPGIYEVKWDGKDNKGKPVASGTYYYQLNAGGFAETKKMVKVR
ncbi:MAG: FG-GAP-like repeat-containing protein [Candidatus Edwardsbacteria bacterium]